MARLIDADALYETISDHVTTVSVCPTVDWAQGKSQMKEICLEDITNAPTVGGWVSVKDRLPEVNKSILYCAFGHSVGEGTYRGFDGIHHVWNMYAVSGTHWDDEVTHWMPLPEPPKEDNDAEQ